MSESPYTPPASNVADKDVAFPRRRNIWIWLIIVYQGWALLGMMFSFVIIRGGFIPIPKQLQDYYDHLGVLDWTMSFISFMLILLTVVFLFRLSKLAFRFFLAELLFSVLMYIVRFIRHDALPSQPGYTWATAVVGYILMLVILSYLFKLQKRGVLQ